MRRIVLRRIVCAVDLSDRSVLVLERGLRLARLHGAELLVLHVIESLPGRRGSEPGHMGNAFTDLQRQARTASNTHTPIRWIVALGNPAMEVARHVRRADANLAIVSRSRPRPTSGVVGTVAEAVLRTTDCPVLVIPALTDPDRSPAPFHEILCGVSPGLSTETLRYALSFAQELESRLTILNIETGDAGRRHPRVRSDIAQLRAAIPESAHEWCEIDEIVGGGDPAQEVTKAAVRLNADLVVVGSTGAAMFEGGLGSVALAALTLTHAHVLIIPTAGFLRDEAVAQSSLACA